MGMSSKEATCGNCGALVTGDFCPACASPVGSSIARTDDSDSVELTDIERDILLAAQLADHLRAGGEPAEKAVRIRLDPGEVAYGSVQAELHVYTGTTYVDPGSVFVAFGSPMWMIGSLGASAAFNSHKRRKAREAAAAQWRLDNHGVMHFTNRRVALQGIDGWLDLYFDHFRALTPTDAGVVAHFADWPMIRLGCSNPAWSWVMLSHHVMGDTPHIEVPEYLRRKLIAPGDR